ncbi:MAG: ATP-binding protein [Myxococcaceae bacterium]
MATSLADPVSRANDSVAAMGAVAAITALPTILRVVTQLTGLRFSAVARVTEAEWLACAVNDEINFGLRAGDPLDVNTTLCREVRAAQAPIIIEHASADADFCTHPTPKIYKFESYIAVPIVLLTGEYFGTLCAFDPLPAKLREPKILKSLSLFAELIGQQLSAELRYQATDARLAETQRLQSATSSQLSEAHHAAELREQFIAVLGHDLRNPIQSITTGAQLLMRRHRDENDLRVLRRIHESGRRMGRMVGDLLDFARARLGGGIPMQLADVPDLPDMLRHVIAELQSAHPERVIRFECTDPGNVRLDRERVGQLLSNLLGNAIEHGAKEAPIDVTLMRSGAEMMLSVRNRGEVLSAEQLGRLFEPYEKGPGSDVREGLGLGLFIVKEIAHGHGGRVEATSNSADGTRFTFTFALPPNPQA